MRQKKSKSRYGVTERGSTNCTKEFCAQVVAEVPEPAYSLAEVGHSHGLSANPVSKWRRDYERAAPSAPGLAESCLPVQIDPPPTPDPISSSGLNIECHCMRVHFEGKPESDVLRLVLTSVLAAG
ncbi:transposase [Burkholderia sp. BCC1996]|uniref:transposase n=1 Tax=unclassified Burkholderia TaxID=2613784 RepID=UPI0039EEB37A